MCGRNFYLDTNVISYLADPKKTDESVRAQLSHKVHSGAIEILGSFEIIEEFAGMARTKAEHFARSIGLFWKLVGENVLVKRTELYKREIKKRTGLTRAEALLDVSTIRRLRTLPLDDVDEWDEIAKGVRGQGKDFTTGMHESGEKVREMEEKEEKDYGKEVRKNDSEFEVDENTVKDWSHGLLKLNRESWGLPSDETTWPDVGQLSCTRAFVSIHMALVKKHHAARDHKYRHSDQHDMFHYVNAAMAECLVTSDRKLRDTASQITWQSIPVIGTEEFLARLKRM